MIHRISSRETFRSLTRSRNRASTQHFTVVRSPGPPECPTEGVGLACSTPRRVGSAVARNRVRRRIRVVVREWTSSHPGVRGWFLVVVRPGAARLDFPSLRAELHRALADLTSRGPTAEEVR